MQYNRIKRSKNIQNNIIKKSNLNLHYTRSITPKRVTNGGAHFRGLAPGQHSSDLTGPVIDYGTSHTVSDVFYHSASLSVNIITNITKKLKVNILFTSCELKEFFLVGVMGITFVSLFFLLLWTA